MCRILSISEYVRNHKLMEDYLSEVHFYTDKFIADSQRLHKIKNTKLLPFKKFLINRYEMEMQYDKSCIDTFTQLYNEFNTQIVQVV